MKAKSFSQMTPFESNLFESTGIRELTPEEIDLVNGACFSGAMQAGLMGAGAGAVGGGLAGAATGALFGPGVAVGAAAGIVGGAISVGTTTFLYHMMTCAI